MTLRRHAILFFATGFGIGKLPRAPGTFGSLEGLALCFLIAPLTVAAKIVFTLIFIAFSIGIAHEAEKILARKDPGGIVIDEISGMLVAFLGISLQLTTVTAGFILFRLLDIAKPFPIRYADQRLPGGAGIVADDLLAGLITNGVLRIAVYLMGPK